MVDPDTNFRKARAERAVGEEPVCDCEGGCIVGWLLAIVGRVEAEEGEGGRCHRLIWFGLWLLVKMKKMRVRVRGGSDEVRVYRRTDFGFEVGIRKIRKSEPLVQLDSGELQ